MYLALAALGGLGFPEMIVALVLWAAVPLWVLWEFYRVFSRIANELAEIKQVLREGKPL
jgi:hypothetical protein